MKKRLLSLVMVAMLAISAAALPNAGSPSFTAYASANYASAQMEGYARQVAGIVNRERAANGLSPLKYSDKLSEAALVRAEEIQSAFSHTRPNGTRCFTAMTEAGINYQSAGENIAYGQRNPEEVMNSWMNSSGHRANILGSYEYIGIGVTYKNGTYYWSQFFASSNDLSGEIITLGNTATSATTKSTTAATSATAKSTTAATSAATKSTTAATSATTKTTTAATSAATKSTTAATSATTKPTSAEQKNAPCNDSATNCNCSSKTKLMRILMSMLGMSK